MKVTEIKQILGDVEVPRNLKKDHVHRCANMAVKIAFKDNGQERLDKYMAKGKTTKDEILDYCNFLVKKAGRKLHKFSNLNDLNSFVASHKCGQWWDDLKEEEATYYVYEY